MSSTESLLPYHSLDRKKTGAFLVIPFPIMGWFGVGMPFLSFVFCVVWSIIYNFEEANATHCAVENYLPSISAAIGGFHPQKLVWMLAITLDFPVRLLVVTVYSGYFSKVLDHRYSSCYKFTVILHFFENLFLLGLTLISSNSQHTLHAFCFVSFLLTSMVYMGTSCYLLKFRRKIPPTNIESRTLKWKFQFFIIKIICFFLAGYFFYRHNTYCEPGVYSIFAMFEYGVVVSNMGFHILAVWDFYDKSVAITSQGIHVR